MILGLEGGVAAGKSTLRLGLTDAGNRCLPEYMDYIDPSIHASISDWSILFKTRFFLEIERARATQLQLGQEVVDRTYLTLLAHDYAREDRRRFTKGYRELYRSYQEKCIHPRKIVFLDATPQERERRAMERGVPMAGYFTTSLFNSRLRIFFERLRSEIDILFVDTDSLTPAGILEQTLRFLSETPEIDAQKLFDKALVVAQDQ
jgi:deoxyadenosine/deoxycytidine kinase